MDENKTSKQIEDANKLYDALLPYILFNNVFSTELAPQNMTFVSEYHNILKNFIDQNEIDSFYYGIWLVSIKKLKKLN